jgi:hypothetical protein
VPAEHAVVIDGRDRVGGRAECNEQRKHREMVLAKVGAELAEHDVTSGVDRERSCDLHGPTQ